MGSYKTLFCKEAVFLKLVNICFFPKFGEKKEGEEKEEKEVKISYPETAV